MAGGGTNELAQRAEQVQPQKENEDDAPTMMETLTLCKPFRMRIKKKSLKVIYIEPGCQSINKAAVGDTIIAIDGKPVNKWEEVDAAMRQPTTKANVTFRRRAFSICLSKGTTVETLAIKNDLKVMRAIQLYSVRLVVNNFEEEIDEESELLGLQIAYDAKERLQIVRTTQDSLAGVHLRSSDIIREVDGHAVASKTMLNYWIMEGIEKRGSVCLSVEAAVDNDEEESEDMPEDVVEIAKKQLQVHRSLTAEKVAPPMRPILRKGRDSSGSSSAERAPSIQISNSTVEIPIASDFDAKTLKRVKKGQH